MQRHRLRTLQVYYAVMRNRRSKLLNPYTSFACIYTFVVSIYLFTDLLIEDRNNRLSRGTYTIV